MKILMPKQFTVSLQLLTQIPLTSPHLATGTVVLIAWLTASSSGSLRQSNTCGVRWVGTLHTDCCRDRTTDN